jgi:hypothetical protein
MPIIADKNTQVYFIRIEGGSFIWDGTLSRRNVTEIKGSVYNYFGALRSPKTVKTLQLSGLIGLNK